jgi:broad specificity phosphatase PhoE
MTRFFLLRHGSTDHLDRRISGWLPGVALNAQGEREVARLAVGIAGYRIDAVYTSPLDRTRQTAARIAQALQLDAIALDAFGELRFGDWTGRAFADLRSDARWSRFNAFRCGTRIPNGELMLEVQARAVAELIRLRDAHPAGRIAVVTHSDVIRAVVSYFMGMPLDFYQRIEVAPGSVTQLELDTHGVRLLSLNELLGGA